MLAWLRRGYSADFIAIPTLIPSMSTTALLPSVVLAELPAGQMPLAFLTRTGQPLPVAVRAASVSSTPPALCSATLHTTPAGRIWPSKISHSRSPD